MGESQGDKPGWWSRKLDLRAPSEIRGPSFLTLPLPPPPTPPPVAGQGLEGEEKESGGESSSTSETVKIPLEEVEKVRAELKELREFLGVQTREVEVNTEEEIVSPANVFQEEDMEQDEEGVKEEEHLGDLPDTNEEMDDFEGSEEETVVVETLASTSSSVESSPATVPTPTTPSKAKKKKLAGRDDDEDEKLDCSKCGVIFREKFALEQHKLTAHLRRKFSCRHCKLQFFQKGLLHTHMTEMHTNVSPSASARKPEGNGRGKKSRPGTPSSAKRFWKK